MNHTLGTKAQSSTPHANVGLDKCDAADGSMRMFVSMQPRRVQTTSVSHSLVPSFELMSCPPSLSSDDACRTTWSSTMKGSLPRCTRRGSQAHILCDCHSLAFKHGG